MFKGTQEAIIDPDTWEIVQRVREGKRSPTRMGTMDKFSGLVFCADCGSRHYCIRATTMTSEQINYICGTSPKKGKEVCTAHFIRAAVLDQLVLDDIRRVTRFASRTSRNSFKC
ncbi:zinc ribbon domain-containing protein [Caproiciproducens sp. LBM24188]